eukprot:6476964-Amphidinium_carterae.1
MIYAPVVCLGHNLLAGSIPEKLFGGMKNFDIRYTTGSQREYIVANTLAVLDVPHSKLREPSCQAVLDLSEVDCFHAVITFSTEEEISRELRESVSSCLSWDALFDGVVLYLEEWHVLFDRIGLFMHAEHARLAQPTEADGMHHEGAIPKTASRMTRADNIVSLGHGLRGLLPSIPGTMSAL